MKRLCIVVGLIAALGGSAQAADLSDVVRVAAGVNGAWFENTAFPADVEVGGNAAASLSPHISVVGAAYYGFDHSYFRWSTGARITVTDPSLPNFGVGLGMQYHGASEAEVRPNEWAADASFGWVPFPETVSRLSVVGNSSYGLESGVVRSILGLRWQFPLK